MNAQQKKQNLMVFLGLTAVVGFCMQRFMVGPLQTKVTTLKSQLANFSGKVAACSNQKIRVQNLEADLQEAQTVVGQLLKSFPDEVKDQTTIYAILNSVGGDLPGVTILKAPPLTKKSGAYRAAKVEPEDIQGVYSQMILEGGGTPLEGETVIKPHITMSRLDQQWEIEADWDSFVKFLNKLGTLPFYFEVTRLDLYGTPSRGKEKIRANLVVSTVSIGSAPEPPK